MANFACSCVRRTVCESDRMKKLLPLITLACLVSCQASEIRPADANPVEVKVGLIIEVTKG